MKVELLAKPLDIEKYLHDEVSDYIPQINLQEAMRLAEESAFRNLDDFRESSQIPLLREDYIEGECCWIFFRNQEIVGPPDRALTWDCAYAVSKKGSVYTIGDKSSDTKEELNEYIQRYSSHLKRTGE